MSNKTSTNLLFLAVGAVVGAAVGYVIACDRKEEWLQEVNKLVGKVKTNIREAVSKGKDKEDELVEEDGK